MGQISDFVIKLVYLYINIFYKINEGNTVFIKFCFHHVLLDIPIFINLLVLKLHSFTGIKKNQFFNAPSIVKGFDTQPKN